MKLSFALLLFAMSVSVAKSQTVETLSYLPHSQDGMHVDKHGNVYTASGGLRNAVFIGLFDPHSNMFDPTFLGGFYGPIDIDELSNGDIIVTNYDNNTVFQYDISEGTMLTIASGLDGPAGIAVDDNDDVYVSNFGAPPLYDGHQIHKITPDGEVSILADTSVLYRYQAMVINGNRELVVSSKNKLFKVDLESGAVTHWTDLLGFSFGHMVYRAKDSCIYGTSSRDTKVYKVDVEGNVSVLVGSVKGYRDGSREEALLNEPQGIGISPDESVLYIGDGARLRKITLDETVDVQDNTGSHGYLFPNPTDGIVLVDSDENLRMVVWNVKGVKVAESHNNEVNLEQQPRGVYCIGVFNRDGDLLRSEIVVKR